MNRRDMIAAMGALSFMNSPSQLGAVELRSPLLGYLRTNWSRDPFSFGSYSFLAAGSGNADRVILAEPVGDRVFFAGEALNPKYQSSVHAAHESGLQAAMDLLQASHARIAIIGAGMCGLSAAQRLAAEGRDVTVFEARDRIGGRIWTDRTLGAPVDLGASWIHGPTGNPIAGLADQAGLQRVETGEDFIIRGRNGRQIWSIFAPSWLMESASEVSTAADFEEINLEEVEAAYEKYGVGYEGQDVIFPNGYDEIFKPLSGAYTVHLSKAVTRVTYSDDGAVIQTAGIQTAGIQAAGIQTADGSSHNFDAVIVTVPLGVLKRETIVFDPALPAEKAAAISRMGMGTLDKLYLHFEDAFWDRKVTNILTPHNDLPRKQFNHWVNLEKYLGKPIIMAFNYGPQARALSQDTDEELLAKALRTLSIAYPA